MTANYLFLDTSRNAIIGQIGRMSSRDGATPEFYTFRWETNRDLANRITLLCDEMLSAASCSLNEISLLGIGSGPGSLTGLRVGMAFMRTLAQAHQKPLIGVDLFSWSTRTLVLNAKTGDFTLLIPAFLGYVFMQNIRLPLEAPITTQPEFVKIAMIEGSATPLAIRSDMQGIPRFDPDPAALHAIMQEGAGETNDFDHLLRVKPMYVVPSQPELKLEKRI